MQSVMQHNIQGLTHNVRDAIYRQWRGTHSLFSICQKIVGNELRKQLLIQRYRVSAWFGVPAKKINPGWKLVWFSSETLFMMDAWRLVTSTSPESSSMLISLFTEDNKYRLISVVAWDVMRCAGYFCPRLWNGSNWTKTVKSYYFPDTCSDCWNANVWTTVA